MSKARFRRKPALRRLRGSGVPAAGLGRLSPKPSDGEGGIVETRESRRILIVAHKTVATPALVEAIRQRTEKGPCTLALLIPDSCDRVETAWTLRYARRMLSKAVHAPV